MVLIDIHGVEVKFPFEPYALQRDYMGKVIDALNNQQNAVLESPTGQLSFLSISQFMSTNISHQGTGKTLCLLTSSLAWLSKKKVEVNAHNFPIMPTIQPIFSRTSKTTPKIIISKSRQSLQRWM